VHGYSIGMRFDTVVDRFAYLACAGMPLTVWESARMEKRPYLHVADATDALIFALGRSDIKAQTYNVIGENASMNRIIDVIKKEVPNVQVTVTPSPSLNQLSYELDGSKIERLGFRPRKSLEDGVREIVEKFHALLGSRARHARRILPRTVLAELSES